MNNTLAEQIKQDRENRRCKGDDCDAPHCPKCGGHTAGYLGEFERCQSCELEAKWLREQQIAVTPVVSEEHQGWPGDGSGTDDLADFNAAEADDYRNE